MQIYTGAPKVTVKIYTESSRYNFTTELGNYQSDILSVTTNKDLNSPEGTFSINFVPNKDSAGKTWFDKINTQDYVEISFSNADDAGKDVIVMRGLVDSVSKSESWEGGTPQRSIVVSGRDFGCLFTTFGVYYIEELRPLQAILSKVMPWDTSFPMVFDAQGAFDFMAKKVKANIDLVFGKDKKKVLDMFKMIAITMFPDDKTGTFYLTGYQGDFWNAFSKYQDKPFHELFVYDGPKNSFLVLRPSKLKDAMGNLPRSVTEISEKGSTRLTEEWANQGGLEFTYPTLSPSGELEGLPDLITVSGRDFYPPDFKISATDKISINVVKNHDEVYSYYFTIPEAPQLFKINLREQAVLPYMQDPENSENPYFQLRSNLPACVNKYGFRKYECTTVFIDMAAGQLKPVERGKDYTEQRVSRDLKKLIERNRTLVAWMLHNEHLLKGEINIRGNNKAIIGTYVTDEDDGIEYYVEGVSHNFVQFQSFTTSLRVTRGLPIEGGEYNWSRYSFGPSGEGSVYGDIRVPKSYQKLLEEQGL